MPLLRSLRPLPDSDSRALLARTRTELVLSLVATNSQRFALVSVVVLGTGAIAFDRLVLGGGGTPQFAAAEELLLKEPGSVPSLSSTKSDQPDARIVLTVAQRLSELPKTWGSDVTEADSDAFALPAHWLAKIAEKPQVEPKPQLAGQPLSAKLHLGMVARSVKSGKDASVALINGKPVKIGESVEGYTLVEMHAPGDRGRNSPAAAILEGPEGRIELTVDAVMPSGGVRQ